MNLYKGLPADELMSLLPEEQLRHCMHVRLLVERLAAWLPESGDGNAQALGGFGKAAYYHDIGKVCVPRNILNKPGKLTPEEYRVVKRHPLFAQELLAFGREYNADALPPAHRSLTLSAAAYHHEWWNGQGYPFGLSGSDIPYVARVTAVCDAYDAMTSNRAYRGAFPHAYACQELREGAGTQFDPALVNVFLEHEAEIKSMFHVAFVSGI